MMQRVSFFVELGNFSNESAKPLCYRNECESYCMTLNDDKYNLNIFHKCLIFLSSFQNHTFI